MSELVDPQSEFDQCVHTMNNYIQSNRTSDLETFLHDKNSLEVFSCNLAFFVQWLSDILAVRSFDDSVTNVLAAYMKEMPVLFDVDETFIVVSNIVTLRRRHCTFCFWLAAATSCIEEQDCLRFQRIVPLFTAITSSLSHFTNMSLGSNNLQHLLCILDASLNFYSVTLQKVTFSTLNHSQLRLLSDHVMFLFTQPLFLIEFSGQYIHLYSHALRLLSRVCKGLYTLYRETLLRIRGASNHEPMYYLTVPAWLRILTYVLLEANRQDLGNCWPLVFSPKHYIDMFHSFVVLLLDDTKESDFLNAPDKSPIPPLSREFYMKVKTNAIELLDRLVSTISEPLTVGWWCPERTFYLELLKSIAKKPVSAEDLPDEINKAIQCLDKLIMKSSYTAQCQLFRSLLPPKVNDHHGLRGHLITLCKDSVHNCCIAVQSHGISAVIESEKRHGEEEPQLPLEKSVLACFSEMVLTYPNSASNDALVDQSSWILSAVSMALYIFLRHKMLMKSNAYVDGTSDMLEALLRRSNGSSRFAECFLNPLMNDLNAECDRTQTSLHMLTSDLEKAGDHSQMERLKVLVKSKEASLLRLRLLHVNIHRLSDCYQLCIAQ